jgi:triosephosphate isomerase (TIM)
MYKSAHEASAFVNELASLVEDSRHREIVICPPYVALPAVVSAVRGTNIEVGAQDVFWLREGAFTGEVSAPMLTAIGCRWVIIGHSERRQYFGETDESVFKKTIAAVESGLKPIVCVGETLEHRAAGHTEAVLSEQFSEGIAGLTPRQFERIVLAYEPAWAIGTGRTASPEVAAAAHRFLRNRIAYRFGVERADECRILYGGSVKPENISALLDQEGIDGALVGGASLDPKAFASIVLATVGVHG